MLRPTRSILLALLPGALLPSCMSIRGDEPASVGASATAATAYWFRGVPINTGGVLQGDVSTSLPLADGGLLDLTTWGNMALTADSGNGAEGDGHGLTFTEIDLGATYTRSYDGFDASVGVLSYSLPDNLGASTAELYGVAAFEAFGLAHSLGIYYDFQALDGFYMNYSGTWSHEVDERTGLDVTWTLGSMGGDQSRGYFGVHENGLSDLSLGGTLSRVIDEATTVSATLAYVMTVDDEYRDALDARDLDDSGFVLGVGASWSF
jgi:hypothetical protein